MADLETIKTDDVDAFARTLYGEASSAGDAARIGVGSVILKRVEEGTWPGGKSIAGVCKAHEQFDCWNSGTPDCERTTKATLADPALAACWGLTLALLRGDVKDNTHGAVFYHDVSIGAAPHEWGKVHLTAVHGPLKFFAKG